MLKQLPVSSTRNFFVRLLNQAELISQVLSKRQEQYFVILPVCLFLPVEETHLTYILSLLFCRLCLVFSDITSHHKPSSDVPSTSDFQYDSSGNCFITDANGLSICLCVCVCYLRKAAEGETKPEDHHCSC